MKMVRVNLPDEFHRRLKARAALEELNVPVMAERILMEHLEEEPVRVEQLRPTSNIRRP